MNFYPIFLFTIFFQIVNATSLEKNEALGIHKDAKLPSHLLQHHIPPLEFFKTQLKKMCPQVDIILEEKEVPFHVCHHLAHGQQFMIPKPEYVQDAIADMYYISELLPNNMLMGDNKVIGLTIGGEEPHVDIKVIVPLKEIVEVDADKIIDKIKVKMEL